MRVLLLSVNMPFGFGFVFAKLFFLVFAWQLA